MKNIAIYTMGRAGTTWLADYIIANFAANNIPVNCLWEYWGEDRVYHDPNGHIELHSMSDWEWSYQNVDQNELFETKVDLLKTHESTVHLYRQSEHEGFSDRPFDYMLNTPAQIICVNRQDKFDQMISAFIARETGQWHIWKSEDLEQYEKVLEAEPVTIDMQRADSWCRTHLIYNQRRKRLIESGLLIANMTYETLFENAELIVKRLLKDRGVETPTTLKPADIGFSTIKLATPDQKQKYVTNYKQLRYWFDKHNWDSLLK
jgi:LPS sulfotransferase NodH